MINLLPQEQIKQVEENYHERRSNVIGVLVLAWLVILALVLASGYLLARAERVSLAKQLAVEEDLQKSSHRENDLSGLATLATRLKTVQAAETARTLPFEVIQRLITEKPSGLKIKEFDLARSPDNRVTVKLAGSADLRQKLLSFLDQLNQDAAFTKVDSPVSNLIKERNFDFFLSLSLARHE